MDRDELGGPSRAFSKRDFLKGAALAAMAPMSSLKAKEESESFRFCFGSCNLHYSSQRHWDVIAKHNPDLWLWLGDNIYGDTTNMASMRSKYQTLLKGPYGRFKERFPIDGIWDDHDFGVNNGDRTYSKKEESQQLHLDFLDVAKNDKRRDQEGIYHTREEMGGKIKFYLLDCRYFRSEETGRGQDLLGEAQWQWLEEEMAQSEADINIIASPIGVLLNRLFVTEDWSQFPDEKTRLMELVAKYDLSGTFFLSGDKHFGAFIKRKFSRGWKRVEYPEFQSSGLTHILREDARTPVRLLYGKRNVMIEKNYAQVEFHKKKGQWQMNWSLHSLDSTSVMKRAFSLDSNGVWKR